MPCFLAPMGNMQLLFFFFFGGGVTPSQLASTSFSITRTKASEFNFTTLSFAKNTDEG